MNTNTIEKHFAKMGARVAVTLRPVSSRTRIANLGIDILRDRHGSFFNIVMNEENENRIAVLDVRPQQQHLLLMARNGQGNRAKHKFLCGHDERDWFVAAVPEVRGVSSVNSAIEALKPKDVQNAQIRAHVKPKHRNRRRNAAFVRQGEWFFLPCPDMKVDEKLTMQNEPLVRSGGGKPHMAEFAYRTGGETVYLSAQHPQWITEAAYRKLLLRKPEKKKLRWQVMRRNPDVYVRGKIRHSDHKTVQLDFWHRVLMNTESEAPAMRHVVFLD